MLFLPSSSSLLWSVMNNTNTSKDSDCSVSSTFSLSVQPYAKDHFSNQSPIMQIKLVSNNVKSFCTKLKICYCVSSLKPHISFSITLDGFWG